MYKGPLEIFHASRGFIFRGNVESEELQTKLFIVKHFTFTGTALSRCRFHGDTRRDSLLSARISGAGPSTVIPPSGADGGVTLSTNTSRRG